MGNEIGQRIRETRTQKGLTQKEIAERCGMADSAIRKYESGTVTPKYETLERIGLALGVEPYWLMTGTAAVDKLGQMANEMLTSLKEHKTKLSELEEAMKAVLLDSYDKLNIEGKDRAIQQVQDLAKIPDYQKDKTPPESE
ncbi:helix-turn-helix transcriptional regulator [Clostridium sp. MSTE9]|uniref:helix-turn-helix domain-containing protein n=1 Tax=Clostridium sp. (strain MSTE9) TaxID=1105031 RepID=UPI00068520B2|nr:helix-turn-helix transcriptional regulator [Clostridium sp. MSTE9]